MSKVNLSAIAGVVQQLTQFTTANGITDEHHPVNVAIETLVHLQTDLKIYLNRTPTPEESELGVYDSRWDRLNCHISAQLILTRYATYNSLTQEESYRLDKFMSQMAADMEHEMKLICQNGVFPQIAAQL